jgi:hypothetical protein
MWYIVWDGLDVTGQGIMLNQLRNPTFRLFLRSLFLLALAMFATEREAHAYTDPGTGALIWQMALAGLAGVAFYFRRITTWFKSRKGPKD